jgi:predicted TIM-barrel fold metal-dependent hydrolase
MREFPETNFTLAHLMGLEEVIKRGKDLTNVYFDTSTYYITSKKRIMKAIRHFGADRVIMGSDSPFGNDNLANIKKKIESLEISNEEKNLVLGGSIAKLLEL